ncbi:serine/threonine-protein kinase [Actinomadura sp. 6N118]|uniref:serine/threonine-protein kinase n=1 Tax=Actinomadura sp. 6N118 TaxID=3375151 RepID=UPI0037B05182
MPTTPVRPNDPERLGHYRITGRLGRGGMGTVYLGLDEAGRRVAIKVINLELSDDDAFNERFRREVTAARQVRRFCTAAVLDARLDGEPLYVVTEYVDGPTLEQVIRAEGPMSEGALEGLAVNIATALGAIHGAGIVHRDLKPSNVLLSSTGPRVIDFGIARALDALSGGLTRTGQFVGTPSYIAPELMRGGALTPAADVFSWGCVMTYAGTGHAPFSGGTIPEIIHRVVNEPPAVGDLDPDLRALVIRALDKDPARRPDTAELVRELTGLRTPSTTEPSTEPDHKPQPAPAAAPAPAPAPAPARVATPPPVPGPPVMPTPHNEPPVPAPARSPSPSPSPSPHESVPGAPLIPPTAPTPTETAPPGSRKPPPWRPRNLAIGALVLAVAAVAIVQPWRSNGARPPTSGDGPPAAGAAVLKDDFGDTSTGWPNGSGDCAGYRDSAFLLDILAQAGNTETCTATRQATVPRHSIVDVKVRLNPVQTNVNWAAGVHLLNTNDDRYDVVLRPDGTARLEKLVGGQGTELATAKIPGFKASGYNRLQAELDLRGTATRIRLWVNGSKIFERSDTAQPLRQGSTGLVLFDAGAKERVSASFDDFTLSQVKA